MKDLEVIVVSESERKVRYVIGMVLCIFTLGLVFLLDYMRWFEREYHLNQKRLLAWLREGNLEKDQAKDWWWWADEAKTLRICWFGGGDWCVMRGVNVVVSDWCAGVFHRKRNKEINDILDSRSVELEFYHGN